MLASKHGREDRIWQKPLLLSPAPPRPEPPYGLPFPHPETPLPSLPLPSHTPKCLPATRWAHIPLHAPLWHPASTGAQHLVLASLLVPLISGEVPYGTFMIAIDRAAQRPPVLPQHWIGLYKCMLSVYPVFLDS